MDVKNKATRIDLFSLRTPQMRAFHMTWFSFFLCFFAWFGIAPLMPIVKEELGLTKSQIGNTIIASVAVTIFARLLHRLAVRPLGAAALSYTCAAYSRVRFQSCRSGWPRATRPFCCFVLGLA